MAEEILTQNPDQLVFGPQGKIHCKSGCRIWTTTGLYTTMVFTIVTIVFVSANSTPRIYPQSNSDNNFQLPLTFLSSIFALNIAQFPHGPSGRPQFESWWIFPLICMLCLISLSRLCRFFSLFSLDAVGPSAAIAIPLIVVAFNVNDFIVTPYYKWKAGMTSSPAASGPGRQLPRGSDDASRYGRGRVRSVFSRKTPNKSEDDKV